ncbi:unnamed protein product [Periconia digitata]|uniref:Uncharacterized protein n=1 Tax=Periconia digitata TaxID=1303443 RepID=A0A9W4UCD7_9PLEO|nr:unnamed protein product [Periconia digitata]
MEQPQGLKKENMSGTSKTQKEKTQNLVVTSNVSRRNKKKEQSDE